MNEPVSSALDADELRLAQLACAKLARLVQGTISIGLPAWTTGVPDPRIFLEDQFRVMGGFTVVLQSVSGKVGGTLPVLRLREQARRVSTCLEELRRHLHDRLEPSNGVHENLQPARESAASLCEAVTAFASLLGMDPGPFARIHAAVLQVFEAMEQSRSLSESAVV